MLSWPREDRKEPDMAMVTRKCIQKNCSKEVLVVVPERTPKNRIYFWKCPWCDHENALHVVRAK